MSWTIEDRTVLVTGGTSGIGEAAATALARAGARVTIAGRSAARLDATAQSLLRLEGLAVDTLLVDLADLRSVHDAARAFARSHDRLDVLINNAGVVVGHRAQSADGYELTFATNHLGPFLLTRALLGPLTATPESRVINTSSVAHTYAKEGILFDDLGFDSRRYKFMEVYGHSKLANILHARSLNAGYADDGLTGVAVHPGVVQTRLGSGSSLFVRAATKFGGRWMATPEEGADTIVWLATVDSIDTSSGIYFTDRRHERTTRHAADDGQAERLWAVSNELVDAAL